MNRDSFLNPFAFACLLVILVAMQIFYNVYVRHSYQTFTTEEQIEEAIDSEFGFFAQYL